MSSNGSWARVAGTALGLIVNAPAFADQINLHFTASMDTFAGEQFAGLYMATYPDSSKLRYLGGPEAGSEDFRFDTPSFVVPEGQTVRRAELRLSFPSVVQYSYESRIDALSPPPGPNPRSVPGRVKTTVTTRNAFEGVLMQTSNTECGSGGADLRNLNLLAIGCGSDWQGPVNIDLLLFSRTAIVPTVIDTGFNSEEFFEFYGSNHTLVDGNLEVQYGAEAITPEPRSWILLGAGMVLVAVLARRRRVLQPLSSCHLR